VTHGVGRHGMGQVHDPELGLDVEHDALADGDRIVRGSEVGEEDDRRRPARGAAGEHEACEQGKDPHSTLHPAVRTTTEPPALATVCGGKRSLVALEAGRMERHDVVIGGSGPAGAATALRLAARDPALAARTVMLEKAYHPRDKTCAGGVIPKALHLLADL